MTEEEPEPVQVTKGLTYIPAELLRRLYTCPTCDEEYISPNALGAHVARDHADSRADQGLSR